MKKLTIFILAILLLAGCTKNNPTNEKKTSANNIDPNEIILFTSTTCPHCQNVDAYINENKIKQKVIFTEKKIDNNKENVDLLAAIAQEKCNITSTEIGIPFLWNGSKCLTGDTDIINFFKEKTK